MILLNITKYARTINPSKTALKVPKIRAQGEQSLTALPWVSAPKGAVAKPEDKQPCKGDRTKPGVNRLKVCAAPGIDKKNNIKPCKGDRIKFVQAIFSNAPTELQG